MTRELRVIRLGWHFRRAGGVLGRRSIAYGSLPHLESEGRVLSVGPRTVFYGLQSPVLLQTYAGAVLAIGGGALLNSGSSVTAAVNVTIGSNFKLGPFASVSDTNSHEVVPGAGIVSRPVTIGDDVWIGRNAIVLPGVTIGSGSVVGAGSVVTRDIPAFSLCVGNPARVIRQLPETRDRRR